MSTNGFHEGWNILEFVRHGLGINLYPVQIFTLKMIYGLPLDAQAKVIKWRCPITQHRREMTERQYLSFLNGEGRCSTYQDGHSFHETVVALGRRGGKMLLSAVCSVYELYRLLSLGDPHTRYGLRGRIQVTSVGITKDQQDAMFSECCNLMSKYGGFKERTVGTTFGQVRLSTDSETPNIQLAVKPAYAKTLHGSPSSMVILDEVAWFSDRDNLKLDQDCYDALTPSTAQFWEKGTDGARSMESKILLLSTPNGKKGLMYRVFSLAMEQKTDALALQIPTWEMNPAIHDSYYATMMEIDLQKFRQDFGAEFL